MAQAQGPSDITIQSLSGGMNDTDPPNALPEDQCTNAMNVEFFASTCGERRAGCNPLDVSATGFNGSAMITVTAPAATNWSVIGMTLAPSGIIAFDAATVGGPVAGVNTVTISHTCSATANYLVVGVMGDLTTDKVTGVTYNAVAMTQLGKTQGAAGWIYTYGLALPTAGAHNVVVSASGVCSFLGCWPTSYSGMAASQPDSIAYVTSTATISATSTLSPVATNCYGMQFSYCTTAAATGVTGGVIRVSSGGAPFATMADTNVALAAQTAIVHLSQWFPSGDVTNPELWAVAATPNSGGVPVSMARRTNLLTGSLQWFLVTPGDPIIPIAPDIYRIDSQPLNAKLFWAYNSGLDRMHVWDGTVLRRTGLLQPVAAPVIADTGVGAYATARYFRTRWIAKDPVTLAILRRSEPSLSVKFTPSGGGIGALVTNSALIGEFETHWEVEASTDNATFYRIATVAKATTTYTDSIAFGTGYATAGPLSEAIGSYLLQSSMKYLATDGARLLLAGHYTDATLQSTVMWSPVNSDPGVGNDERQPIVTTGGTAINTSATLDPSVGGPITGLASGMITPAAYSLSTPVSIFYVFKWSRTYMMVSTGDVAGAYKTVTLSTVRGAIPGSVFNGIDESGAACVYFLDPLFGPSRAGQAGLQLIVGLRKTWKRVNLQATGVLACGCHYPYKQQAHWWVAADSANTPNLRLVLQISSVTAISRSEVGRGWTLADGRSAQALCAEPYTELVIENGVTTLSTRPFIGLTTPDFIQRMDVDSADAGQAYSASITTRPYVVAGLIGRFGTLVASLLAGANSLATVYLRIIRDMGKETTLPISRTLTPETIETFVVKDLNELSMSNARTIQVQISDS